MDTLRVVKSYRGKPAKVLPLPKRGNVFSKLKRLISSNVTARKPSNEHSAPPTRFFSQADIPKFDEAADETENQGNVTNRVLSNFFAKQGDKPLSEVEYEGVLALLERSKASVTLPMDVSMLSVVKHDVPASANTTIANQRHQHKISKNNSIYDTTMGNTSNASYRPTYHTLGSVPARPFKRVYQFSGVPLPYSAKLKMPPVKKHKPEPPLDLSINNDSLTFERPLSNTANSLLSALDGKKVDFGETSSAATKKQLENQYTKLNRRNVKPLTAADISKTMAFNTAEVPGETKQVEQGTEKKESPKAEPVKAASNGDSRRKGMTFGLLFMTEATKLPGTEKLHEKKLHKPEKLRETEELHKSEKLHETEKQPEKQNGSELAFVPKANGTPKESTSAFRPMTNGTPKPAFKADKTVDHEETPVSTKPDPIVVLSNDEPEPEANLFSAKPVSAEPDYSSAFVFPTVPTTKKSLDMAEVAKYENVFTF